MSGAGASAYLVKLANEPRINLLFHSQSWLERWIITQVKTTVYVFASLLSNTKTMIDYVSTIVAPGFGGFIGVQTRFLMRNFNVDSIGLYSHKLKFFNFKKCVYIMAPFINTKTL